MPTGIAGGSVVVKNRQNFCLSNITAFPERKLRPYTQSIRDKLREEELDRNHNRLSSRFGPALDLVEKEGAVVRLFSLSAKEYRTSIDHFRNRRLASAFVSRTKSQPYNRIWFPAQRASDRTTVTRTPLTVDRTSVAARSSIRTSRSFDPIQLALAAGPVSPFIVESRRTHVARTALPGPAGDQSALRWMLAIVAQPVVAPHSLVKITALRPPSGEDTSWRTRLLQKPVESTKRQRNIHNAATDATAARQPKRRLFLVVVHIRGPCRRFPAFSQATSSGDLDIKPSKLEGSTYVLDNAFPFLLA